MGKAVPVQKAAYSAGHSAVMMAEMTVATMVVMRAELTAG